MFRASSAHLQEDTVVYMQMLRGYRKLEIGAQHSYSNFGGRLYINYQLDALIIIYS